MTLPTIPVIDARHGGVLRIAELAGSGMRDLLREARRGLTPPVVALMEAVSRRWLESHDNPYLHEIRAIAGKLGKPGAHALNASYEWACTSGVGADPGGGIRLLRVLDWELHGLGRNVVCAWQRGPAGDFLNLTWPGYVGVVTAIAPGRFAVAINQPPITSWCGILPVDWVSERIRIWRAPGLPPAHLLRRACETCADYAAAKRFLAEEPLCHPAFFSLAGTGPWEGCVIERHCDEVAVRDMPAAVANHWVGLPHRGRPRGRRSRERLAHMQALLDNRAAFAAEAPIINRDTRLVALMNPATGRVQVQGWERQGPATAELRLDLAA